MSLSFDRWGLVVGLVCCLFMEGCTKEVPLEPVFTGESDWAPRFVVTYNNYQCIRGNLEKAPRISLLRNIDSCVVQARSVREDSFVTICPVLNVDNVNYHGTFSSPPVFEEGQSYTIRLATYYKNGVIRYSADTAIIITEVHGRIVKMIYQSPHTQYRYSRTSGSQEQTRRLLI